NGVDCGAGSAVRLLPIRPAHVGRSTPRKKLQTHRRRDRFRDVRQHLPLRNLPTHPARDSPRRRGIRRRMTKTLNRRTFLRVSAAGGGALLIGGYLPGLRESGTARAAGTFEPNIWLKVGADDSVTIMLTQLEMGQGV